MTSRPERMILSLRSVEVIDEPQDRTITILGTSRAVHVFAYPAPVDLRKGYDGLYGLVQTGLDRDRCRR